MLVLSRAINEKIIIEVPGHPTPIVITLAQVQAGKARIGIDADKSVKIDREEIKKAKESSASPPLKEKMEKIPK